MCSIIDNQLQLIYNAEHPYLELVPQNFLWAVVVGLTLPFYVLALWTLLGVCKVIKK